MGDVENRPVLAGLLALVGVGLAVGLFLGLAALAATEFLGIGDPDASSGSTSGPSMFLPSPERTLPASGPGAAGPGSETPSDSGDRPGTKQPQKPQISLSADQDAVSPMQQIDLTGAYPRGEGAILQVQRATTGAWQDFPVTASVGSGTFSTYVLTSQTGLNRFRVVDTDTGLTSNVVRVRVG